MRRLPALLCTIVCTVVLLAACSEPPRKEIVRAQEAIDAARAAGAERYAPESFAAATTALQQSNEAVDQRDYRLALSRAVDASDRAQEAAKEAADAKAKARSDSEAVVNEVNAAVPHLEARLRAADAVKVPARELAPARRTVQDAGAALQKARALLAAGNYDEAKASVKGLAARIRREIQSVEEITNGRAAHRPARRR
jgi:hypothetical protein